MNGIEDAWSHPFVQELQKFTNRQPHGDVVIERANYFDLGIALFLDNRPGYLKAHAVKVTGYFAGQPIPYTRRQAKDMIRRLQQKHDMA